MGSAKSKNKKPKAGKNAGGIVDESSFAGPVSAGPISDGNQITKKDFRGPLSAKRSCTDIICLLLFLIVLIGFVVLTVVGLIVGNPLILFMGHDSNDHMCGVGDLRSQMYTFSFDPIGCIATQASSYMSRGCSPSICVQNCPGGATKWNWPSDADKTGEKLPEVIQFCLVGVDKSKTIRELVTTGQCPPYIFASGHHSFRCEPSFLDGNNQSEAYLDAKTYLDADKKNLKVDEAYKQRAAAHNSVPFIAGIIDDLGKSWPHLLILTGITMGVSFIWIVLLRFFGPCLIWFSVLLIVFGTGAAAIFCWIIFDALNRQQTYALGFLPTKELGYLPAEIYLVIGLLATIAFLVLLIIFCVIFNRIRLAATIVGESSRAVAGSMGALIWPILPFTVQLVVHILFGTGMFYFLTSTSNSGQTLSLGTLESNLRAMWPLFLSLLFAWFWIINFILAVNYVTLAGSFSSWYWNNGTKHAEMFQLFGAFWRAIRYHMGTMAFGALLIAIIQLIRVIVEFFEHQFRRMQNPVGYLLLKCLLCCLCCVQKLLKLITKNAYIMVALKGRNFCYSALKAFTLASENSVRIIVLDAISSVMITMSIFIIVCGMAVVSLFVFYPSLVGWEWLKPISPQIRHFYIPLIVEVIASAIAAICFFSVFKMAIDTIFMNLMYDLKYNDGSLEKPYRAKKSLLNIVSKKNVKQSPKES